MGDADTGRSLSPSEQGEEAHPQVDAGLPSPALRRVTLVLCLTQIVSWGVLFYAFPVLAPTIAKTEGWSLTTLMAGFTGAQVWPRSSGSGWVVISIATAPAC